MKFHCYRSDSWGGGFYVFGFRIGKLSVDCRWSLWSAKTGRKA